MTKTSIFAALAGTALLIVTTAPGFAAYGPIPYSGDRLEMLSTYVDIDAFGPLPAMGRGPIPYSGNGLEQASTYVDIDAIGGIALVPEAEMRTSLAAIDAMNAEPAGVPYASWRMASPGLAGGYLQ
jgi:hypothetical protein